MLLYFGRIGEHEWMQLTAVYFRDVAFFDFVTGFSHIVFRQPGDPVF